MKKLPLTQEELFMRHVEPIPHAGCWIWMGTKTKGGYGTYSFRGQLSPTTAHRAAWLLFRGPVAEDLEIDHKCRVTFCVNPDHLEPVTQKENKHRAVKARTHCRKDHEYTPENTRIDKNGRRWCRHCCRARERQRPPRRHTALRQ